MRDVDREPGAGSAAATSLSRRRFIRSGTVAGAGASVLLQTSKSALGREATPDNVIRCGIIGYGDQGRALREAAVFLKDEVRFAAVAEMWERNRRAGVAQISAIGQGVGDRGATCNAYEDATEMLEREDLDAVLIATPPAFHRRHTENALDAGLHVYCEKPMAHTIEDAQAMLRAQRASGNLLQIGHQRRSNPRYRHALDRILRTEKLLGWVTHAEAQWNRSYSGSLPRSMPTGSSALPDDTLERYGYPRGAQGRWEHRNWRLFRRHGAGIVGDLAAHQVDIFNWFFGATPRSVQASGGLDYFSAAFSKRQALAELGEVFKRAKSAKRRARVRAELQTLEELTGWRDPGCIDNALAIYEYETPRTDWGTEGGDGETLITRATYQCLTTNSSQKFYEKFMGEFGTMGISELSNVGQLSREAHAESHDNWRATTSGVSPLLKKSWDAYSEGPRPEIDVVAPYGFIFESRPSLSVPTYELPDHTRFQERPHTPHLRNFFRVLADGGGQDDLNCPASEGYKTCVAVLKIDAAIERRATVDFAPEDFAV